MNLVIIIIVNTGSPRTQPLHDSHQIFAVKLARYKKEIGKLRDFYTEEHANWTTLDGEKSKWWLWNECVKIGKASVVQIQTYLQRIMDGRQWLQPALVSNFLS